MSVLPDDYVSGHLSPGFECVPNAASRQAAAQAGRPAPHKVLLYFEKNTGIPMKRVERTMADVPVSTTTVDQFVVNPSLDPARFRFELPDGVELINVDP